MNKEIQLATYRTDGQSLFVTMPYVMKDAFKLVVKRYKWLKATKEWRVSARREKQVVAFIELINNYPDLRKFIVRSFTIQINQSVVVSTYIEVNAEGDLVSVYETPILAHLQKVQAAYNAYQTEIAEEEADNEIKRALKRVEKAQDDPVDNSKLTIAHKIIMSVATGGDYDKGHDDEGIAYTTISAAETIKEAAISLFNRKIVPVNTKKSMLEKAKKAVISLEKNIPPKCTGTLKLFKRYENIFSEHAQLLNVKNNIDEKMETYIQFDEHSKCFLVTTESGVGNFAVNIELDEIADLCAAKLSISNDYLWDLDINKDIDITEEKLKYSEKMISAIEYIKENEDFSKFLNMFYNNIGEWNNFVNSNIDAPKFIKNENGIPVKNFFYKKPKLIAAISRKRVVSI